MLLAGTSFLVLFLELALIRFLPAQVKLFSYYTNFVLLAAFLGSGLGLLLERRAGVLLVAWPAAAVVLFSTVYLLRNVLVPLPERAEFLWGIYGAPSPRALALGIVPTVILLFTLVAALFVPLGARLGQLFTRFTPLMAYSLDIVGALAGVLAFALASRWSLPPVVWFGAAFTGFLVVSGPGWRHRAGALVAGGFAVTLVLGARHPGERWSPYYRIDVYPGEWPGHEVVNVNGSLHQFILNFADTSRSEGVRRVLADYLLPFAFVERVDTTLVLGAGAGNDVSVLLAMGARYVDAVEIDPDILALGRERNLQRPYSDPRVHLHVDDARAFLRTTGRRYDLIIYATLDSQTLLSGMTSLRLDNYMYTVEAMASARELLKPDGRLITYHMSAAPYIAARIYQLLYRAFGAPAVALEIRPHLLFNWVFVAGAPRQAVAIRGVPHWLLQSTRLPTDQWPYLYLRQATVPRHYLGALAGVLVVAVLAAGLATLGSGGRRGLGFDAPMFFMGAGFLLIETKSVTEMALLMGSTWTVNVLVFSAVLAMILAANLLVHRGFRPPLAALFSGLFVALALGAATPIRALAGGRLWLEWGLGSAVVALPVLFAALIFARLFASRAQAPRALGWNLIGAIVGGVVEYTSMIWGIKALYLMAALAYGGVLPAWRRESEERASGPVSALTPAFPPDY